MPFTPIQRQHGIFTVLLASAFVLAAFEGHAQVPIVTVDKGQRQVAVQNKWQDVKRVRDVPGGAALVDEKSWENRRADNVKDIVDFSPGVFSQSRNGAESSRLSIRGSGLAHSFQGRGILVLQDGIPINTADGGFEFPVIDPWLIQYAQILRGANAAGEGASTLGGAINLITPTGLSQQGGMVRAEGGSFGDKHGLVSYGGQRGEYDAYAATSLFRQNGFRDHNRQNTERVNANFGWQASPLVSQRIYVSETNSAPQIPGAVSKAIAHSDPRQANVNNINGDYRRDVNVTRLAHRLAWEDGPKRFESTVYAMDRHLWNPVTTFIKEDNRDVGWRSRYSQRVGHDTFTLGVNGAYGVADEDRFTNVAGSVGAALLNRDMQASTWEAYGEIDHALALKWHVLAGAQVSYATRDIEQSFPVSAEQQEFYTGVNPRIGLRYDASSATQIFANLSRSFEPPTLDELSGGNAPGFNQLKAQRATTAEVGTRTAFKNINLDAAYYYSWLNNEFVNYQFANGSADTINASRSVHEGVELGLNGVIGQSALAFGDRFTTRHAFAWNHFRLDGDPLYGDNILPGVPEYYLRSDLIYHHPAGFSLGPNIEYAPRAAPVDLTNSLYADAYFLVGLNAAWQHPTRGLQVFAEARNLADTRYIATNNVIPNANGADGNYFYPGEGRSVFVGIKAAF